MVGTCGGTDRVQEGPDVGGGFGRTCRARGARSTWRHGQAAERRMDLSVLVLAPGAGDEATAPHDDNDEPVYPGVAASGG